ncbi:MAG: SAM-dependent methyltransferase [Azospirillaceae bacterium]|nr:SAM-dependent methyltransferase [Azospirillaceae bacterium]
MENALPSGLCPTPDPLPWIARFAPLVSAGGPVLDVACGAGRHLRLFRGRGHPVTGLDRDLAGLADLVGVAAVTLVACDLEDGGPWPLPGGRQFAAVVVTNYLYRPLFPVLLRAVAPGGWLLYQTFARGQERRGRPANPDFLLGADELFDQVRAVLTVVAFEQGVSATGAVVQRVAARRAALDAMPCALS